MVELDNATDGTRVVLARGGEVKVLLDTNLATSLQWDMPAKVAPVLAPIGQGIYVGKGRYATSTSAERTSSGSAPRSRAGRPSSLRIGAWASRTRRRRRRIRYEVIVP